MKKIAFIIAVIAVGYHYLKNHQNEEEIQASQSPNGFVEVFMPSGLKNNKVYIMAPQNCPKEAGRRADALERELREFGIPVERNSSGSVSPPGSTEDQQAKFKRTVAILKGEIPAVFVNGMAKPNPHIDEIISEYKRTNEIDVE